MCTTRQHLAALAIVACWSQLLEARSQGSPSCVLPPLNSTVLPSRYHDPVPGLDWLWWDGISPSLPASTAVNTPADPTTLILTLQGRGAADPLDMARSPLPTAAHGCNSCEACLSATARWPDPFGAGMRLSSRFAYLAGRVCADVSAAQTYNGTIWGMYIISSHPPPSRRNVTVWREADFEWLGRPDQAGTVDVTVYPYGLDELDSETKPLTPVGVDATVHSPVRYCLSWDFRPPNGTASKYVLWQGAPSGQPMRTLRRYNATDSAANETLVDPMKVVFTVWSSASILDWTGSYIMPADAQMAATFANVSFEPIGPASCPENDEDLQPMSTGVVESAPAPPSPTSGSASHALSAAATVTRLFCALLVMAACRL